MVRLKIASGSPVRWLRPIRSGFNISYGAQRLVTIAPDLIERAARPRRAAGSDTPGHSMLAITIQDTLKPRLAAPEDRWFFFFFGRICSGRPMLSVARLRTCRAIILGKPMQPEMARDYTADIRIRQRIILMIRRHTGGQWRESRAIATCMSAGDGEVMAGSIRIRNILALAGLKRRGASWSRPVPPGSVLLDGSTMVHARRVEDLNFSSVSFADELPRFS